MPTLATKPTLALTACAAVVMGASGVSAAARAASATGGTSPTPVVARPGPGGGFGPSATALASKLGVSVADLQAAVKAVRASADTSTASDDRTTEAKTIADELGVGQSTIQAVFDAETPTAHDGRGGPPLGGSGQPAGTTPPAAGLPAAPGADDAAVVAAIAKATGKSESAVKAAVQKANAVRDTARRAREAEFAKKLAEQLHLDQDKVLNAVETSTPSQPARAARQRRDRPADADQTRGAGTVTSVTDQAFLARQTPEAIDEIVVSPQRTRRGHPKEATPHALVDHPALRLSPRRSSRLRGLHHFAHRPCAGPG